jgi:membrane protein
MSDNVGQVAQAIGYNSFLAIPSALLVAVGAFGVFANPATIHQVLRSADDVLPRDVINLLSDSLTQITNARQGGLVILLVGVVLGVWSLSGSMQTLMWGLNVAFQRQESRGFVRRRLIALAMVGCTLVAFAIVFVLFVLAPKLSHWAGEHLGYEHSPSTLWTVIQWPVVVIALLLVFAMLMRLGPDLDEAGFHPFTVGGVTAVAGWLVLSDVFASFTSRFGSYNKMWGSLAAVIVVLVWLRLSALVLLFGAELNAERASDRARVAEYDSPHE